MKIEITEILSIDSTDIDPNITCTGCKACCCKLEVILISDTGVPEEYIGEDQWGGEVMKRLDDGWCIAVDRETLMCTIYENRPWVCREFEMGSYECVEERQQM
ncbi:YkgJ family cysteine cluster protein [Shewanella olleyana]|uniref:YkgJ family cysteine cluster protein n=1 Tax=Shewanella olleyana TaxID=135626 RepID=UPI0020103C16|nr:YkgJ family cysteine cluster protein [Shewanella olleyana]MCL1068397.1 YkgJ family cysteine cluster protein [Shewanella olleyana]